MKLFPGAITPLLLPIRLWQMGKSISLKLNLSLNRPGYYADGTILKHGECGK
jgi:hypothetical protein